MKVAVTGGSGQLGGVLLRRLIDDRTVKSIVSLDVRPPLLVSGKLKWHETDIRDPKIEDHFEGADAVFHLAFVVTKKIARAEMDEINIGGSKNVFRAAARRKVKKIIYASSVGAYGMVKGHPVPLVEDSPRKYQSEFPYAAQKFEVEAFLDEFEREVGPGLSIVRMRPSVLFGARIQHAPLRLMNAMMARGLFPDLGMPPVAVVWDEDVADAMMLAFKKDVRGPFILSADEPAAAPALAAAAGLRLVPMPVAGLDMLSRIGPILERIGVGEAVNRSWLKETDVEVVPSSQRAKDVLGWKPKCPRAVDVIKRWVDVTPGAADRRILTLFRMVNLAGLSRQPFDDLQAKGVNARVHLCLTGKGGGDFTIHVEEDRVRILREVPRPPTSVATMPATLWLDLLAGRSSFATAQLTGRVRVEGDPLAGFLIGTMIARYQQLGALSGMRGMATRALTSWINQGGTP